jgi:DNA topoisomerase-2
LRNKLEGTTGVTEAVEFVPYYEGFKGSVRKISEQKYLIKGVYEKLAEDKIRITELPVGTWTMPYVTFLEGLMDGGVDKAGKKIAPAIKDFTSVCTEVAVDITVVFAKGRLDELLANVDSATGINGLEKLLKLTTTESTTNMHMFDAECKLHKYRTVEEIIDDFSKVRLEMYGKRKAYLVKDMQHRLVKLSNRARYILANLDGSVDLRKKTAAQVSELLIALKFDQIDGDFKYLIKMPMDSVTQENVDKALKEKADTERELATLQATSLETMWLSELANLEKEYDVYKTKRELIQSGSAAGVTKVKKPKVVNSPKVINIAKK